MDIRNRYLKKIPEEIKIRYSIVAISDTYFPPDYDVGRCGFCNSKATAAAHLPIEPAAVTQVTLMCPKSA